MVIVMKRMFGSRAREAQAIRDAVELMLATRVTTGDIADRWNSIGLTRINGEPWASIHVRQLLQRGGARAALDEATWQAVQVRLRRAPLRPRWQGEDHLTGLASCGLCGASMMWKAVPREPPRYVCQARHSGTATKDGRRHPQVKATLLEGRVRLAVCEALARHDGQVLGYTPDRLESLTSRLGALRSAKVALAGLVGADGDLTAADVAARIRLLDGESAVLDAEVQDRLLADALMHLPGPTLADYAAQWDDAPVQAQRVIATALLKVTVWPGTGVGRIEVDDLSA